MSAANKLKRYSLIIEKIRNTKYPSLKDIEKTIRDFDEHVSGRTIQRDIEQIRNMGDIIIEYDYLHKGYFIEEDSASINKIRFLQAQAVNVNFLNFMKENPKLSDAAIIMQEDAINGVEYIDKILLAIRQCRIIEFTYKQFEVERVKQFSIQPYALKEYQNRWYLVGVLPGLSVFTKFGLDRVQALQLSTQRFTKNKAINVREHFSKMIGISSNNEQCEIVQLLFKKQQAKYIETLPLHFSQKAILADEFGVIFEYFLIINNELKQRILSYGDNVKVVQPKWLATEHKKILKNVLKQY